MEVVWLTLVLQGGTAVFHGWRVVPTTICVYKEYHDPESERRYVFNISPVADCPPFVRHKQESQDGDGS